MRSRAHAARLRVDAGVLRLLGRAPGPAARVACGGRRTGDSDRAPGRGLGGARARAGGGPGGIRPGHWAHRELRDPDAALVRYWAVRAAGARSTGARAAVWRAAQGPLFGPSDLAVGGLSCAPAGARVWPSGFRGAGGSRVARQGPARHRGPPCTSPAGSGASQTRIGGRAPVPAAMRPPPSRDRALRRHVTQRLVRTAARCGQRCWRLCRRQRRARRSPAEARAAVLTA